MVSTPWCACANVRGGVVGQRLISQVQLMQYKLRRKFKKFKNPKKELKDNSSKIKNYIFLFKMEEKKE